MKSPLVLVSLLPLLTLASDTIESDIAELAQLLAGEFRSHIETDKSERLVDRRVRLDVPALGTYVFYQQINSGADLTVYRQRIVVLSVSTDGMRIEQQSYSLKNPAKFVDATAALFSTLSEADIVGFMPAGCAQVWTRFEDGFRGYVDPRTCRIVSSRTSKLRAIEAESIVSRDSLSLVERGYDPESNEQLFGSPQGESNLLQRIH